jgi:hypothetical protein
VRQLTRRAQHGEYLPVFPARRSHRGARHRPSDRRADRRVHLEARRSATFVAGRVSSAIEKYANILLPPFFGAMVRFAEEYRVLGTPDTAVARRS